MENAIFLLQLLIKRNLLHLIQQVSIYIVKIFCEILTIFGYIANIYVHYNIDILKLGRENI
jgi:hypothetical protein